MCVHPHPKASRQNNEIVDFFTKTLDFSIPGLYILQCTRVQAQQVKFRFFRLVGGKESKMSEKEALPGANPIDSSGEVVFYQQEGKIQLPVRVENDTVWLHY